MPAQATHRHSFVVRIWREEGRPGWRGWVQHAGSGEATYVRDLEELLAFMESRTGELAGSSPAPDAPLPTSSEGGVREIMAGG